MSATISASAMRMAAAWPSDLVRPRQHFDFAPQPIKQSVQVSGRFALKPLGVDGNPLTLGTSIATRAGARRRHRPEMRRENKLAVRLPESAGSHGNGLSCVPHANTGVHSNMSDASVQAAVSFIITFRKKNVASRFAPILISNCSPAPARSRISCVLLFWLLFGRPLGFPTSPT